MKQHKLDLLGEVCPSPLVRTREILAALPPGDTLIVECDYARSVRNISHWAFKEGLDCRVDSLRGGVWRVVITKAVG